MLKRIIIILLIIIFTGSLSHSIEVPPMIIEEGYTPLMWATVTGNLSAVRSLIESGGADLQGRNKRGMRALDIAKLLRTPNMEIIRLLESAGVIRSSDGRLRSSDGRYIDNEDGTITDTKTGLMWTKKDSYTDLGKCLNWNASKSYVSQLTTGDYSNWRLPTVKEYKGIYEKLKKNNGLHFDSIFAVDEGNFYWSSETVGSEKARFVFFLNGVVFDYYRGSCYAKGVRAVRRWDEGSFIPAAALEKVELELLATAPKIKELGKLSEDQIFELMDLMGEAADNGLLTPLALEINEAILNEELILRNQNAAEGN